MSGEMIAIVAIVVTLAGVILTSLKGTETRLREDMKQLSERVARVEHSQAKLEGLLEGLREAITVRATGSQILQSGRICYRVMANDMRHPVTLNHCRPSIFSAACPGCGRTLLGLFAALSPSLPAVFAAVTVVVLVSLFPATVEGHGAPVEPCSGGGYDPVPTAVEVGAVPIVVESTTEEYFVLYVRHDLDTDTTVELPILVKRGEAGTTTLAENVAALPKERYRVEKYLIADPADVDGDCIDDISELADPVGMNPVNPAAAIELINGALAVPDRNTFRTLSLRQRFLKFIIIDIDTDRPSIYFMNNTTYPLHITFLDTLGLKKNEVITGHMVYNPLHANQPVSSGCPALTGQNESFPSGPELLPISPPRSITWRVSKGRKNATTVFRLRLEIPGTTRLCWQDQLPSSQALSSILQNWRQKKSRPGFKSTSGASPTGRAAISIIMCLLSSTTRWWLTGGSMDLRR